MFYCPHTKEDHISKPTDTNAPNWLLQTIQTNATLNKIKRALTKAEEICETLENKPPPPPEDKYHSDSD